MNNRALNLPFVSFGRITSDDLFGPNEQVIFDFYESARGRYKKALDVGANIGVHSLLMRREGWQVRAFEPDPEHFEMLCANLQAEANDAPAIEPHRLAVSDYTGTACFVRVKNNLTGNHIQGDKVPYGPTELVLVNTIDCRPLFAWADFAKIDCEGHEAKILLTTDAETWAHMEAMVEVGNERNAWDIYRHLRGTVPMWSQKRGWAQVEVLEHMPWHHSEGSLFIGNRRPF